MIDCYEIEKRNQQKRKTTSNEQTRSESKLSLENPILMKHFKDVMNTFKMSECIQKIYSKLDENECYAETYDNTKREN